MQIAIGLLFGILISTLAWRLGSLSVSGAMAAAVTGGLIFGLGGLSWAVLLLTFFGSSSALSKAFRRRKQFVADKFSKGHQRDWGQVLANGGLGTLLVIAHALHPEQVGIWLVYVGVIATVNADTWATELGVLNPRPPRLLINGQLVEPGTSGAISLYGTVATLLGAFLIGLVGAAVSPAELWISILIAATLGGLSGSLFDSLLGATVQAIYYCPTCQKETERHPAHSCGSQTAQLRGWLWLNNDLVNVFASMVGGVVAGVVWLI
jgi:uncharacterized protein (TIGR00297 family)